jgi:hypothetical protein
MGIQVTPVSGAALDAVLDALLPSEPELAYANFAPIAARADAAIGLHRDLWRGDRQGTVLVATRDGEALAALRVEPRPFESEHFGIAMARCEPPLAVASGRSRSEALARLYGEALVYTRDVGFAHLALRASTRDPAACWALQTNGGFHVDTQVSWMAALSGTPHDAGLAPPLCFEVYERDALARLVPAHWKRLAEWAGRAFDRGPLVFDRTLPEAPARRIYQVWTERVMTGDWADAVLLVRAEEEIVAFISMREMPELSRWAGVPVCGRGLGATLPEYRGLFTAIQHEMVARRPLGAAFMENETQVSTIGSINVYAKLGFRFLRSTSTFHFPGDRAPAR